MISFNSFLIEAKNTHMEHLEDMMFNDGVDGTRQAINFLRDLRDMLSGHGDGSIDATVKWDGAPAIFAGIDPSDKKFFVGTKGVFAKRDPKLIKSVGDISKWYQGDLAKKLKIAYTELSKLGIRKGVYQGDIMFTRGDIKAATIDGQKMSTFHPNTIVYAIPTVSPLGSAIKKANIGVVWHTTYTGGTLEKMSASFGKKITSGFRKTPKVWMADATYQDVTGKATFTSSETGELNVLLSQAGTLFQTIKGDSLRAIAGNDDLKMKIKSYNNTYVRAGEPFPDAQKHAQGLYNYITDWYKKEIDSKKTQKSKDVWAGKEKEVMSTVFANAADLVQMFKLMNVLVQAKMMVVNKMNMASSISTFIKTTKGFKVTGDEGYVAIDKNAGAVKIVDRLEFSRANFSSDVIKGWEK